MYVHLESAPKGKRPGPQEAMFFAGFFMQVEVVLRSLVCAGVSGQLTTAELLAGLLRSPVAATAPLRAASSIICCRQIQGRVEQHAGGSSSRSLSSLPLFRRRSGPALPPGPSSQRVRSNSQQF